MKKFHKFSAVLIVLMMVLGAFIAAPAQTAKAAVGFHISGRNLLDANNNNFIIRGVSHAHVWYPDKTASIADIKTVGKANSVRVVLGGGRWGPSSASDVTNIINLCKASKLICVLENHDTTGYGEDGAATTLATAVNYWKSIQSALTGQEAYIIINIGNEPYGNTNAIGWVADTKNAIIAMRAAGFQHTLMVDAPNWGQDWSFTMRDNAASVFAADTQANTMFSVHMYGVFDTAAEINSYVNAFKTANLPLLIGEFGFNHSDGNPDEDTLMATAVSEGIGYMGWSWSGNGGGVEYLDMTTSFNAAQLTSWGQRIINGANGLAATSVQASVFGGVSPTITPGGPTATRTNTALPATNTATLAPSSTPVTGGTLKVQMVGAGTDNTQQSAYHIKIMNIGSTPQSNISARIYFTTDGSNAASNYALEKYYDQSGIATVSGPTLLSGSTYYYTLSYGTTALAAGAAWEYHTSMHLSNWASSFSSANDFWHGTGTLPAAYTDWASVPAYINGALIWGNQPGGSTSPTNTPAPVTNTPAPLTATVTRTNTAAVATNTPVSATNTPIPATATRTNTPVAATNTPTSSGTCTPTSTITAPFSFDGAGTYCWQISNIPSYINSWNTGSVSINGVTATNLYIGASSLPAKIGGYYYISYNSTVAWGHFEAK